MFCPYIFFVLHVLLWNCLKTFFFLSFSLPVASSLLGKGFILVFSISLWRYYTLPSQGKGPHWITPLGSLSGLISVTILGLPLWIRQPHPFCACSAVIFFDRLLKVFSAFHHEYFTLILCATFVVQLLSALRLSLFTFLPNESLIVSAPRALLFMVLLTCLIYFNPTWIFPFRVSSGWIIIIFLLPYFIFIFILFLYIYYYLFI